MVAILPARFSVALKLLSGMFGKLNPLEASALLLSVRYLAQPVIAGQPGTSPLPEPPRPYDLAAEVAIIRKGLEQAFGIGATDAKLIELRDLAVQRDVLDHALMGLGARVNREEARFYNRILVARGSTAPPLNRAKTEEPVVEALALRMVIAAAMLSVPDEQVIAANRRAFALFQQIEPDDERPEALAIRLALESQMDFLGYFMDQTGITARFMAGQAGNDA